MGKAIKKRGFNLEDTHMTDASKLEKLFALVSLAFLFSYAWGWHMRTNRPTTRATERKSLFRQGLEDILPLLTNEHLPPEERQEFLQWIQLPTYPAFFIV